LYQERQEEETYSISQPFLEGDDFAFRCIELCLLRLPQLFSFDFAFSRYLEKPFDATGESVDERFLLRRDEFVRSEGPQLVPETIELTFDYPFEDPKRSVVVTVAIVVLLVEDH
jgi:hypothetical protein